MCCRCNDCHPFLPSLPGLHSLLDRNAQNCHLQSFLHKFALYFAATWSRFVPTTIRIFQEMWSRFVGETVQIFQPEIPDFLWRHSLDYRRAQQAPSWIFQLSGIFQLCISVFSTKCLCIFRGVSLCDLKLDGQRNLMLGHIYIKPISGWLKNSREERSQQDFGEFNERAFWARGELAMHC